MSEIKRRPIEIDNDDGFLICFDDNHTHMDIIRYLLTDLSKEELKFFIETADD